jgi:hypothetical protein
MTIPANPYPDVPLPAGAEWNGDWEDFQDDGISAKQARELATLIIEAADELEGWVTR